MDNTSFVALAIHMTLVKLDLAGLVCNKLGNHQCINPKKGQDGGQTWEYRSGYIDGMISERKKNIKDMNDKFGDL